MDDTFIRSHLAPNEILLWSGTPKRKFRFERKHLPILFFILPFIAFMIFPIIGIFAPDTPEQSKSEPTQTAQAPASQTDQTPVSKKPSLAAKIIFAFFFLCFFGGMFSFIFIGLGNQFGGIPFLQKEIVYGVTNHRLIIVTGQKQKLIESIHLGSVSDIRMKEWPDGLGSISFGPELSWPYSMPSRSSSIQIQNISEPGKVFQIILQSRSSR